MSAQKKLALKKALHSPNLSAMLLAVKDVLVKKKGYRPTAREFGVDRCMLNRYTKKLMEKFDDIENAADQDILKAFYEFNKHVPSNQASNLVLLY